MVVLSYFIVSHDSSHVKRPSKSWERSLASFTVGIILAIGRVFYSVFRSVFSLLSSMV